MYRFYEETGTETCQMATIYDMRPSRIISDKYNKNKAFPVPKCIRRCV